jgi:alpha-beta hydrolase superfamily lysophospholipase
MPKPFPGPGARQHDLLRLLPEADEIDFAPHIKLPVLMVNGRYDFISPVEASQKPWFRALGTPENLKRHVVLETPHNVFAAGSATIRIILDWLDKYLGPVQ